MYPLQDGAFAPFNHWYVAAWTSEISRTPLERVILGHPVVPYRKEDGGFAALAGCVHTRRRNAGSGCGSGWATRRWPTKR